VPYWRLFYHLVWATKGRLVVLGGDLVRVVERSVRSTACDQKAIVHAVGMMPDHVHVTVSLPPSVAVATSVGRLKGAASHAVNAATASTGFAWQTEYGALSFGEKALSDVIVYVLDQPSRHTSNRVLTSLERHTDEQPPLGGTSDSARGL